MTTRRNFIEKVSKGLAATAVFGPSILDALKAPSAVMAPVTGVVGSIGVVRPILTPGRWYRVWMLIDDDKVRSGAVDLETGEAFDIPSSYENGSFEVNLNSNGETSARMQLNAREVEKHQTLLFAPNVKFPEFDGVRPDLLRARPKPRSFVDPVTAAGVYTIDVRNFTKCKYRIEIQRALLTTVDPSP